MTAVKLIQVRRILRAKQTRNFKLSEPNRVVTTSFTLEGVEANIQQKKECSVVPAEVYQKLEWKRGVTLPHYRVIVHHSYGLRNNRRRDF